MAMATIIISVEIIAKTDQVSSRQEEEKEQQGNLLHPKGKRQTVLPRRVIRPTTRTIIITQTNRKGNE